MIGERELRALPRSAYLLNPARGPIVQQDALLRALRENWIAGAALDTHYQYPTPPDHPLWQLPNVIFTPHIAGSSLSPAFPSAAVGYFRPSTPIALFAANRCSMSLRRKNWPGTEAFRRELQMSRLAPTLILLLALPLYGRAGAARSGRDRHPSRSICRSISDRHADAH